MPGNMMNENNNLLTADEMKMVEKNFQKAKEKDSRIKKYNRYLSQKNSLEGQAKLTFNAIDATISELSNKHDEDSIKRLNDLKECKITIEENIKKLEPIKDHVRNIMLNYENDLRSDVIDRFIQQKRNITEVLARGKQRAALISKAAVTQPVLLTTTLGKKGLIGAQKTLDKYGSFNDFKVGLKKLADSIQMTVVKLYPETTTINPLYNLSQRKKDKLNKILKNKDSAASAKSSISASDASAPSSRSINSSSSINSSIEASDANISINSSIELTEDELTPPVEEKNNSSSRPKLQRSTSSRDLKSMFNRGQDKETSDKPNKLTRNRSHSYDSFGLFPKVDEKTAAAKEEAKQSDLSENNNNNTNRK